MIWRRRRKHNNKRRIHMKIATIIARSLLGLIFVVFGSNMFLHFIPIPPPPEGPAREFMTAMFMGLGKTAQAIAACHALWHTGRVRRGLLVVPASLKPQWLRE